MKILFIGGTGNISTSCSRLAMELGHELWLLHRPGRPGIAGAHDLACDINDEASAAQALAPHRFDVVVQFIAFTPEDVARDLRLLAGKCDQYVFLSSASAYAKPRGFAPTTERTPLENPHWQYSRDKIACEELLVEQGGDGMPYTIVRPSHTYDQVILLPIGGWQSFTAVDRMRRGLPVIVPGDGTSLWTVTHAEDFAQGLLGLLWNPLAMNEDFQITSDEALTWNEIYLQTALAAGVADPKLVHIASELLIAWNPDWEGTLLGDKSHTALFDNSKLRRAVPGFQPKIPFREGVRRTMAWFDADPSRRHLSADDDAEFERILSAYGKAWPAGSWE
ncbi:NAD-dependent epimerase/dehydratase family protein [Haloferula sp.]|uniref:NAD-dependent epimerase/dehydratase family protein n=1 Tax=Haloferula sp. TaxID=2497595 RepID=UPI003C726024